MWTNKACFVNPVHEKTCLSYKFDGVQPACLTSSNVTAHITAVNLCTSQLMHRILRVIAYEVVR